MSILKNSLNQFIKTLLVLILIIIIPNYLYDILYRIFNNKSNKITTMPPITMPPTTMPPTTMPPTTMPPTTMPPTTMPPTTMPPTTMPPTTMPPTTMPPTTKQFYNKLEDIELPSSISKEDEGYISKNRICFRDNINKFDYTNKRNKCMACQVDLRKDTNINYDNTNTNIIVTCPYTTSNYKGVHTKEDCINLCKDVPDISDDDI